MIGGPSISAVAAGVAVFVTSYLVGSIPWAYIIVKAVTGEDITTHGTGNVGAMNVRRTTESWSWFVVAMVADALKGLLVVVAVYALFGTGAGARLLAAIAVIGAVVGHDWSLWLLLAKRRILGGKGLATGGGGLLVYDWRYFVIALVIGLGVIALTRYMMAAQVAAAVSLPLYTIATRQPDWPLMTVLGAVVYLRHHRRFIGLLKGEEPRSYVHDRQGPRG
jgi:glycerol-3-phosphate acyltransferase PlsY